jgi:DNA repair protein RecN (Recombination protein N)
VIKLTDGKTTRTSLTHLSIDDRTEELARMLGGIEVTSKAREHAREMLKKAEAPKSAAPARPSTARKRSERS